MKVELKVLTDLINEKNKIIKKNIITKYLVDTENIQLPQEIFNSKGTVMKNKCKVVIKDIGSLIVNHSFTYIKGLIETKTIKGFKR